jgi:hypothetical protein
MADGCTEEEEKRESLPPVGSVHFGWIELSRDKPLFGWGGKKILTHFDH